MGISSCKIDVELLNIQQEISNKKYPTEEGIRNRGCDNLNLDIGRSLMVIDYSVFFVPALLVFF